MNANGFRPSQNIEDQRQQPQALDPLTEWTNVASPLQALMQHAATFQSPMSRDIGVGDIDAFVKRQNSSPPQFPGVQQQQNFYGVLERLMGTPR